MFFSSIQEVTKLTMAMASSFKLLGAALIAGVHAQFPPKPEGITTIQSRFHKDVTISYKEVNCPYSMIIYLVYES